MTKLHLYRLITFAALAWSGWFIFLSYERYFFERKVIFAFGIFWPEEYIEGLHRSTDWHTPLLLAVVPLALLGCAMIWRWVARRRAR